MCQDLTSLATGFHITEARTRAKSRVKISVSVCITVWLHFIRADQNKAKCNTRSKDVASNKLELEESLIYWKMESFPGEVLCRAVRRITAVVQRGFQPVSKPRSLSFPAGV